MLSRHPRLRSAARGLKRRVRAPILRCLRSWRWYRRLSRLPRNEVVSCRDYAGEHARDGWTSFSAIHPRERVAAPPVPHDADADSFLFADISFFPFPETFAARLSRCRLYGRGVAVIGEDERLIAEGSVHIGGRPEDHAVMGRSWLPRAETLAGTTAVLSAPAGNTYYHWLFDVLPRIALLEAAGIDLGALDRFAVNSFDRGYQRETLGRFHIDASRIVETDRLRHLVCERMVLPSYPGASGFPPRWACEFLRRSFLAEPSGPPAPAPERIYVSRQGTPRRRIENHEALEELLARSGFETVHPERLAVAEQARLFDGARVIVAPHGSGLANLAFCRAGTQVIELFPPDMTGQSHYFVLSRQMELHHRPLVGDGAGTRSSSGDFRVPLERLARLL